MSIMLGIVLSLIGHIAVEHPMLTFCGLMAGAPGAVRLGGRLYKALSPFAS